MPLCTILSKVIQTIKYVNNIFLKIPFSIHVHLGSHEIIENNYIKVLFTQCAIFPFFIFSFFFICAIVAVLKSMAPIISVPLSNIINTSLDEGIFPSLWKAAKVVPIFKSGIAKLK